MSFLGTLLGSVLQWLLGKLFPGTKQLTPEAQAQKSGDRADALQSEVTAVKAADQARESVGAIPSGKLREPDRDEDPADYSGPSKGNRG